MRAAQVAQVDAASLPQGRGELLKGGCISVLRGRTEDKGTADSNLEELSSSANLGLTVGIVVSSAD